MTFEQGIQVAIAIGTWFASIATIAAVIVALYLAKKDERVRIKVNANLMSRFQAPTIVEHEFLSIRVTNLGARPVEIVVVGWCIGKGKKKKKFIQTFGNPESTAIPARIPHGGTAHFTLSPDDTSSWIRSMADCLLQYQSGTSLDTLRVLISTSTGEKDFEAVPSESVVEKFRCLLN